MNHIRMHCNLCQLNSQSTCKFPDFSNDTKQLASVGLAQAHPNNNLSHPPISCNNHFSIHVNIYTYVPLVIVYSPDEMSSG